MNYQPQKIEYVYNLKLPNGAIYEGQVFEGRPNGRGKMRYSNNERYEGDFFKGMKHGKGKYYYMKGQLYIGDWFQNKKHGNGQYFYINGDIYTGAFENNLKHGPGRIEEANSNYYSGQFYMNNKDNKGVYYDVVNNKKIQFLYDKGKIINQQQKALSISPDKKYQSSQQQIVSSSEKIVTDKKIGTSSSNINRYAVSYEDLNSGDFTSSEHKKNYATNLDIDLEINKSKSVRKTSQAATQFRPQNYIDPVLLKKKINDWEVEDVATWLNQIGFGDCIEDFKQNNIQGDSLLVLYNEDLKQLKVNALGDRRILLRQIQLLRLVFKSQCQNQPIIRYANRQLDIQMVRDIQSQKSSSMNDSNYQMKPIQKYLISSSSSSSSSLQNKDDLKRKESRNDRSKDSKKGYDLKKSQNKNSDKTSIQYKVSQYLDKRGIKLTFLRKRQELQILKPIGKGGYGQVFLGKLFGQQVAVKRYLKKRGVRNKHIANFIEQVQVISKLSHPCIVLYMGMCIYDNQYLLITEFLSGGSLFDHLHTKKQTLDQQLLIYLIKDVSLGMAYLHSKNMLHCDLKSSNLLIDQNQNIKLCDFGLSRIITTKSKKKSKNIRVGTPHWMAPQILRGGKYETPSDVYSFGILMWQMMTGKIPYKDYSTAQIIGMVGNDQKHHIGVPDYPNKAIVKLFMDCTQRDTALRPNFKAIVHQIEQIEKDFNERQQRNSNPL